ATPESRGFLGCCVVAVQSCSRSSIHPSWRRGARERRQCTPGRHPIATPPRGRGVRRERDGSRAIGERLRAPREGRSDALPGRTHMRRSPLALVLLASTASAAPTTTIIAHVESVIDGDTVMATAFPWPDLMVLERTRFPWTPVWANEAGRSDGIGDDSAEEWRGRGGGDGGGGADGRGATRAVECAREDRDRVAAAEGRGAGHGVAGDPSAGTRARAVAADLPRGRDERVQAARQSGGGTGAQARAGEGRRADDEARDRGVVPRKKRLRGGAEEVEALRGAVSPGTQDRYPVTLICAALHAPRSRVYATAVASAPTGGGKRGPKTTLTDEELLGEIRTVLAACPFHSEGHRKVHFRLRAEGIRVGRKRVLRVMG